MNQNQTKMLVLLLAVVVALMMLRQQMHTQSVIIGGAKDAHGCLTSAGYTWCASNNKCQRNWEEPCPQKTPEINTALILGSAAGLAAAYGM